jgi:hypothetical protein
MMSSAVSAIDSVEQRQQKRYLQRIRH